MLESDQGAVTSGLPEVQYLIGLSAGRSRGSRGSPKEVQPFRDSARNSLWTLTKISDWVALFAGPEPMWVWIGSGASLGRLPCQSRRWKRVCMCRKPSHERQVPGCFPSDWTPGRPQATPMFEFLLGSSSHDTFTRQCLIFSLGGVPRCLSLCFALSHPLRFGVFNRAFFHFLSVPGHPLRRSSSFSFLASYSYRAWSEGSVRGHPPGYRREIRTRDGTATV